LENTPPGELMRQLDEFLKNKWTEAGLAAAGILGITIASLGAFVAIFIALGFINKAFIELCDCPRA
jgi:hypothetical protein